MLMGPFKDLIVTVDLGTVQLHIQPFVLMSCQKRLLLNI